LLSDRHSGGGLLPRDGHGIIRVRFCGKGNVYTPPNRGSFSWLLGRRANHVDMDLHLNHADNSRENHLRITVVFRAKGTDLSTDLSWRKLCTQIFCDLRAYLMGQTGTVSTDAAC
jgi:hypothetical protein